MAFYCLCMLEIAVTLTDYDPMYEEVAYASLSTSAGLPMPWIVSEQTTTRCGIR
jgi:hypothetical protein